MPKTSKQVDYGAQLTELAKDVATFLDALLPNEPPKQIAECADLLYVLDKARLALSKQLTRISELERAIEVKIIEELPQSNATGISGQVANVRITTKAIPIVDTENGGWDRVWGWIRKQKGVEGFALLQRRLNAKALQDLTENGVKIPGITSFIDKSVSCTKAK